MNRSTAYALALCLIVACAAQSKKSQQRPQASSANFAQVASDGGDSDGEMLEHEPTARENIQQLSQQIEDWREQLGMDRRPTTELSDSAMALHVKAIRTCSADDAPRSPRCQDVCDLGEVICENAEKICRIAKEIGDDSWADGKCNSAKASCKTARKRCCACSNPQALPGSTEQ